MENAFSAFSKDLVGAFCASTGPAASTRLFVSRRPPNERRNDPFAQWKGQGLQSTPPDVVHDHMLPMREQRRLHVMPRKPFAHEVRPLLMTENRRRRYHEQKASRHVGSLS